MRVIRGLHNIKAGDRQVAVSLGNYDGVHRGHRELFAQLGRSAPGLRRCAVCFEPQPLEVLRPDVAPVRLQSLAEKLRCLRDIGVEQVLVLRFNQSLCRMPAPEFVRRVLIDGLGVRQLLVGDDYRFGHERKGDLQLLRTMAEEGGYQVDRLPTVKDGSARVSSTRIRDLLASGQLAEANQLLGRDYRLRGRVVHGLKLGRELGAPTANIALRRSSPLRHGVYCVRLDGRPGVANIGLRPTLGGLDELLEVHLLDGTPSLYGRMVAISFERFLRPELKFDGLEALREAINEDIDVARRHFKRESQ